MNVLSNLILILSSIMILTSCSNKNKENNTAKTKVVKSLNSKKIDSKISKGISPKNNKNLAFAKGEIILKDGVLIKILSKLDVYMSSVPKEQVEFIKSLRLENFKGIYWVMNNDKIFIKIKGLDISKIVELLNKDTPEKNPKYKKFNNLKYFKENKVIYATDGKQSYISSENIDIKNISDGYNMEVSDKLNNLIKESKNNGFYFSLYGEEFSSKFINSFPSYLKSLKGASLFSYENNGSKLRLLVKLNKNDAKVSAENFDKMYKIYKPMLISQANNFEKMLLAKKDIDTLEKDAYKKIVKEFIEMANSLEIKSENENLYITINIKSLESAIIITGVLSAIAIPSYIKYIKESK